MMNGKKAFWAGVLAAAGVFCVGSLAAKQMHKYENYYVYTLSDGTVVESFRPEPSDVAEALKMQRWHFRATLPPNSNADCFRYTVEARTNGVAAHASDGQPYVPRGRTMDIWVSLRPQDGYLSQSKKITAWASNNFPPHTNVTINEGGTYDNPFYKGHGHWEISNSGSPQKDNSLILMRLCKPHISGPVDAKEEAKPDPFSIVLKIKSVNSMKEFYLKTPMLPAEELSRPFWTVWLHWFD